MMKRKKYVEATESVTVETVTARLVGMEINVNSSATSPPGRASEDAHLQMAKSAATEGFVCVVNVPAMMLTRLETGEIFTGTPVSVTKGTAGLSMTDTLTTSVLVTGSVTVEGVTAERAGPGRSVSTRVPARCRPRRAPGGARGAPRCLARGGVSANVANALATRRGTAGCTARRASVTTAAVRTWTAWSAEATARVPVVAAFAREGGSESCASIRGSVT